MSEHCTKEGDIAEIRTEVRDLKKIVKGNGQKGLQAQVTELNIIIPELKVSVDELNGKVQMLLDRKIGDDAERAVRMSAKQKLAAIVTGIIGASTTIVMIVDMYLKTK